MDLNDIDSPEIAERHKMLKTLSDDLFYEGWDKASRFWIALGTPEDPYLEYVGSYALEPAHWMFHRAQEGKVKDHVLGVVTCWESWTYPKELRDYIDAHSSDQSSMAVTAFSALLPPDRHPGCCNLRTVVGVFRDGVVLRATQDDKDESGVAAMQGVEPTGDTGDSLVDFMRCLLGLTVLPAPELPPGLAQIISQITQAHAEVHETPEGAEHAE